MTGDYRGSGEASYHPSVLLGLLVYGYATGVFSSRKLERATYDSVAFRFLPVAGLAFEQPATPIGIDDRAAAMGTDRGAVGQIAKIDQRQRSRRRGHEKMLRHGSRPGKGSWLLTVWRPRRLR